MLTRLNCAPKDYLRVCFSLCIHLAYWELLYLNWKKVLIKTHDGLWDYWEGERLWCYLLPCLQPS